MKRIKSLIVLVLFASLSILLIGCKNNKNNNESASNNPNHNYSYKETSNYLYKDKSTNYEIVIPANPSVEVTYAKDELIRFFKEATGIILNYRTDDYLTHNENNEYISLGETTLYSSSGLDKKVDKDSLKLDGARILTKDKSIFFIGGTSDRGVLYGVYDFLSLHFNFEFYYKDCYTLDSTKAELKLMNYDVTDIPDIEYRQKKGFLNASTSDTDDMMFSYRMRALDGHGNLILPIHETDSPNSTWSVNHNSFYYLPPAKYMESHPKFYSTSGLQLCFTCHGDEEELQEMARLCAEKMEQSLVWYPTKSRPDIIAAFIGINDMANMCDCDSCQSYMKAHNNANSACLINFINMVGKLVNEWMDKPENEPYKRDLQYMFFSYTDTSRPPIYKDENGNYVLYDDLKSPEGVKVAPFCAQNTLDSSRDIYDPLNDESREFSEAWAAIYDNCWSWSYGGFFLDYLAFYDCYNFYTNFFGWLKDNKFQFSFVQAHDSQRGSDTGFFALSSYVTFKLSWDSSLDMEELIDNYLKAMYKDAYKEMKELFTELRMWFVITRDVNRWNASGNGGQVTGSDKYISIGLVNNIMDHLNKAYEIIEMYKKDEKLYKSLKEHIDMEWIFPAKVIISVYSDLYTEKEMVEIKAKFKEVISNLGIIHIREFTSIDSFIDGL